jgi:DNA-binding CsgD family transcriptional regulator
LTPKQIAGVLDLSESAVHLHLRSARRKLDCKTIEQAVAIAVALDLIRPC